MTDYCDATSLTKLSPFEKRERTRASFEAKILLLEAMALGAVPLEPNWPKTVKALAAWSDPVRGLHPWAKPNVVSPAGPYGDLRHRYDKSAAKLRLLTHGDKVGRKGQPQEISWKQERARLVAQIALLSRDLSACRRNLGREQKLREIAIREKQKALADLAAVVRFPRHAK